jgi:hypothetical protein
MKYVWAAYKRGAIKGPLFPEGLEPADFRAKLADLAIKLIRGNGEITILVGKTAHGQIPLGLVITVLAVGGDHAPCASSHVQWFPEASARNKLECGARFLVDLKETVNVSISAAERDWPFYAHLCKYGILRPVGKYRKWFMDGGDAMLYQAVR